MEDNEKEAIIRAKQAISPASLADRSDKAITLPGNDSPDDSPTKEDEQDDSRLTKNSD